MLFIHWIEKYIMMHLIPWINKLRVDAAETEM